MPHPISITPAPLPITEEQSLSGEELLAAILQVMAYGTTGSTTPTPPTLYPDENGQLRPRELATPEQQLMFRQLAVALSAKLNVQPGGGAALPDKFDATYEGSLKVGDLVRVAGNRHVRRADPRSDADMPSLGIVVSIKDASHAVVQTRGYVENIYKELVPNQMYFVGDDGRLSPTPPSPKEQGETRWVQKVGLALDNKTLNLNPSNEMVLRRT